MALGCEVRLDEGLGEWQEKKLLEDLVRLSAFLEQQSGSKGYPPGRDWMRISVLLRRDGFVFQHKDNEGRVAGWWQN
jgi:hypothetical protein